MISNLGITMAETFNISTVKLIGIDPSGAVRQLLSDVFRTQGFENVQAMSSVKDVLSALEVEKVDFIVTPLCSDQTPNGLQLLKIISETPELTHTRVAFLLEEGELSHLPLAFSLGLLTWFPKPFNKDSLTQEIVRFKEGFEAVKWDSTRYAANRCLLALSDIHEHQLQLNLCRSMINLYPGEASIILSMAKPLFELKKIEDARSALHQVKLLSKDLDAKVDELAKSFFGDEGLGGAGAASEDILRVGSCAIIDPDKASADAVKDVLGQIGVKEVLEFQDGNSAWIWLQENPTPGIIFMEWRIPELTGPYLIQRIRKKFPSTPIVVVSSLIEKEDIPLLHEMGVTEVIPKPIEKATFLERLVKAIREEKLPTDVEILERKIRQALASRDVDEAKKLMDRYIAEPTLAATRRMKIEAEFAYFESDFIRARNLAAESLRGSPDSVMILNLLGKTLMQLHEYEASLKCFEKAQDLSPKNIQRLCSIAEVNAELQKKDDSEAALDSASDQDAGNPEIKEAEAKVAVASGDTDKAKEIMSNLDSLSELISYMNNKAVSLAKCGRIDEGIEVYRRTIASVPDKNTETKGIVLYNLALAFVRMGEQGEAAETLQKAIDVGETRVTKKSKSLKQRLEKAMEAGQVITLGGDGAGPGQEAKKAGGEEIGAAKGGEADRSGAPAINSEANRAVLATVQIKPGDLCCFRLFNYGQKLSPQVSGWFEKLPRFKIRHAIAREEARGADKLMSAG
jgi:DNA-binding response OmpR family regulator/thioredoxin-like negative regulator of GroEL